MALRVQPGHNHHRFGNNCCPCILDKKVKIGENEFAHATWGDISFIYSVDKNRSPRVTKLSQAHVDRDGFSAMNVGMATSTLRAVGEHVAAETAAGHEIRPCMRATHWYCSLFFRANQILTDSTLSRGGPELAEIKQIGAQLKQWRDDIEAESPGSTGRTVGETSSFITWELYEDAVSMCNGIVLAMHMLDDRFRGIKIPAKFFNQNVLEGLFGVIRNRGSNNNPGGATYGAGIRSVSAYTCVHVCI